MIGATDSTSDVVIYTSLAPNMRRKALGREIGESYQRACIESWRKLGTEIVSLNSGSEIRSLSNKEYGVSFLETSAERPRIADFVNAAQKSSKKIAAIVNADCLLTAAQPTIDAATRAAAQGMVLFERLNVQPDSICPSGVHCSGFDLFLFRIDPLESLALDERFTIGSPWWDYYFPLAYEAAGGKLYSLPGPALIHLDHPRAYSTQSQEENEQIISSYIASGRIGDPNRPVGAAIRSNAENNSWTTLAARCF